MRADSDSSWGFFWAGLLGLLFLFRKAAGVATFAVLCGSNRDIACGESVRFQSVADIPFRRCESSRPLCQVHHALHGLAYYCTTLLQGELASGRIGFRANWLQGDTSCFFAM
jgi:hypothetical protein